jgi:hypothetical protein
MAKKQIVIVEPFDGTKQFKANGTYVTLPIDEIFEVGYEVASILVANGYGELID